MPKTRLAVGRALLAGLRAPFDLDARTWKAVAVPALILAGIVLLSAWLQLRSAPTPLIIISYLAFLATATKLAVTFQRCLLLPTTDATIGDRFWGWTESRYLLMLVGLTLCLFVLPIVLLRLALPAITFFLTALNSPAPWLTAGSLILGLIVLATGAYVPARLALMLPAIAVEQRAPISRAWQMSRGNGVRLLVVLLAFPGLIYLLLGQIERLLPGGLTLVLDAYLAVVDLAILTLAYGTLADPPLPTKHSRHPTDDPTRAKRLAVGVTSFVLLAATASILEYVFDWDGLTPSSDRGLSDRSAGEGAVSKRRLGAPVSDKGAQAANDGIQSYEGQGQFLTLSKSRVPIRFVVTWRVVEPTAYARTLRSDSRQVEYRLFDFATNLLRSRVARLRDAELPEHLPETGAATNLDHQSSANTNPLVAGIAAELSDRTRVMGIEVAHWRVEPMH